MIADKMKAVLRLTGKKESELAKFYGISSQGMHNKFSRGSFSMEDGIKIAEFCGAEFCYLLPDGHKIVFDVSDLRQQERE